MIRFVSELESHRLGLLVMWSSRADGEWRVLMAIIMASVPLK